MFGAGVVEQWNCDHSNTLFSVSSGAAEGEAPRRTSFIRGDGALFAAGIAAGLSHFLPSQTRCAGDEAILLGAAAQHCQTPNDPEREEPRTPSDARRTQQQRNSSSSGSGAHTILMVGAGGESGVNR